RISESIAWSPGEPIWIIPDVSAKERNWLFRHAELVLYPSANEGFGLIPNEAASFGTPSVLVPFGPFERFKHLPVLAKDWSPASLADASELLREDPALRRAQVEAIANDTERYDWDESAARVVTIYESLLARPARSHRY